MDKIKKIKKIKQRNLKVKKNYFIQEFYENRWSK